MKLVIDGMTFHDAIGRGGIGRYLTNLIGRLVEHPGLDLYVTAGDDEALGHLPEGVRARITPLKHPIFNISAYAQSPLDRWADIRDTRGAFNRILFRLLSRISADVYLDPNPLILEKQFLSAEPPCRLAVTIHDVIALRMRSTYHDRWPRAARDEYMRRLSVIGRVADVCLMPSEATRADYEHFQPDRKPTQRSVVTREGVEEMFFRDGDPAPDGPPYVLSVTHLDPRKNLRASVSAFAKVVRETPVPGYEDLEFRIVCGVYGQQSAGLARLAQERGVGDRVQLIGYLTDEELVGLYRGARLLFFPSAYEGFGLPVVESLACGTPVLIPGSSSLGEFHCPEGIFRVRLGSVDTLAEGLREALVGLAQRRVNRETLRNCARQYTWDAVAARTLEAL